ncbi:accessory gene regulator B family protein [Fusibacter ferrireducens]|uniref:Accessory gene regulator B family protein n=1 Tax=Fusibacter ferrireducens TaxID=2785058 RepID=A0ABR9ZZJ0_9FIRM|nr:accessory gene regulator B family protein [Fusibacter ferrireducens]MBF4695870.1 accessory gene regulator B family protein [Fusibacter ferrireducens]
MLHRLSLKMSKHIVSHASILKEDQIDTIRYAIETLLGELSKFVLLWLIFYLVRLDHLFLMAFIFFSCMRVVAGGFHFSTYLSCLFGSFIMYTTILLSAQFIPLISFSKILLLIPSMIILYLFTPVIPHNRYEYNKNAIHKKRSQTAIMVLILFAASLYTNQIQLYILSLFVFALQLLIGGLKNEKLL